jgi:hypothetical protein
MAAIWLAAVKLSLSAQKAKAKWPQLLAASAQ